MASVPISLGMRRLSGLCSPLIQHCQQLSVRHQHRSNPSAIPEPALINQQLCPEIFYHACRDIGVSFFAGVPDSLLKDLCAYVTSNALSGDHVITANEGSAVGMATGHYLATGRAACVYLQNSGLGNMVNPLMSMAHPAVHSIPILLLLGWRGEPGNKDEPQHIAQGPATPTILECMDIPCEVLPTDESDMRETLKRAGDHFQRNSSPFALLIRTKTFSTYTLASKERALFPLTREQALIRVVESMGEDDAIVSSTGMLSRELFEHRANQGKGHMREFLTVGAMGHVASIAMGIAMQKPNRMIFSLDGDGAAIMHMGSFSTIGQKAPPNLKHVIFNNGAHDSVGGQPTEAGNHEGFDFGVIAKACGYRETFVAYTEEEIVDKMQKLRAVDGPALLEVKIQCGNRKDLGRPTRSTHENKMDFMKYLED